MFLCILFHPALPLALKENAVITPTTAWWNQSRRPWSCAFYLTWLDPCLNAIPCLDAVLVRLTLMLPNFSHNMMMPHVLPDRVTWPFIDFTLWLLAVTFTFDASYLGINRAKRLKWCCKFELFWKSSMHFSSKVSPSLSKAWFSLQGWTQGAFKSSISTRSIKTDSQEIQDPIQAQ